MKGIQLREFKPTFFFLTKFVGIYLVLNLLYGFYITAYYPKPDPVTHIVSENSAALLRFIGLDVVTSDHPTRPTTALVYDGKSPVTVYEGCNGINVMIVFLAFTVAFGPIGKKMLYFLLLGFACIYLINLIRIILLFWVSRDLPHYMYFTHKYFFTAIIYVMVLILWIGWVRLSLSLNSKR
ncbi:exosortase family protein XrtF [Ohtaekwangia sp.]|uniref:exosortase family protein XrtF n=1 Tax=Ohtaekwangia sp. TaxID=2066019 RepID=UPI002F92FFD7